MKREELEERLIDFSVMIIEVSELFSKKIAAQHLVDQIIRSGTAPALNYGEAEGAESRKDFLHKVSIVLKELRETEINLKVILKAGLCSDDIKIHHLIEECDQLIRIFCRTVQTVKKNAH